MMCKKTVVILTLMATLMSGNILFGLDPEKYITQYIMDTWNTDSGLHTNSVSSLLQTSDGYLWLGTEEGLLRFDGITFTTFDERNTPEITDNYIHYLYEDCDKNLWIGLRNGQLIRYKNGIFTPYTGEKGFPGNSVNCITEGPDGAIWIGSKGLYKFQDNKFSSFTKDNILPHNIVKTIYKDSKNNLWFGTLDGLVRLKDNKFSTYHINKDTDENNIRTIFEEKKTGNLWIGTLKGLYLMKNDTGLFVPSPFNAAYPDMKINSICADGDNNIWICTYTQGIFRYRASDETFSNLSKANGFVDDIIRSITVDREGSIWIGTALGGVARLRDGKFCVFGTREGLVDDVVFAIIEDRNHYVWIGTNNGLTRLKNEKELLNFGTGNGNGFPGLSNQTVDTLYEDSRGAIWVGTDKGLNQLQNSPAKIIKWEHYIPGNLVGAVTEDSWGNLWVGTDQELFIKEKNSEKFKIIDFKLNNAKDNYFNHVNLIYEDKNRNLWISVYGRQGLAKFSEGSFTIFDETNGLAPISLQCIYEDVDVLWLGTIHGLIRFKNNKFNYFTMKDGLFNNNIYKILEDSRGNFWINCNKGFFSVRKKDLNDYADGKKVKILCTFYDKDDGMRSSECNGGFQTAGCKTHDGKLWFPTSKGVVIIIPEKPGINPLAPPVVIENILLDGVPIPQSEKIKIKPGVKRIEFRYTGLSFRVPKRVKFKYRLEGYNKEWVEAGTQRTATYTNLDGG
ncbi:MAG: hypothetical protein MUF15_13205, partial [Acidobacteria bacterium]|nr:hypothetical protein [Acidobacteriota bacterium]